MGGVEQLCFPYGLVGLIFGKNYFKFMGGCPSQGLCRGVVHPMAQAADWEHFDSAQCHLSAVNAGSLQMARGKLGMEGRQTI